MSKLGYLLTILALCVIGYGLVTQLFLATRTTVTVTAAEAVKHIRLHIRDIRSGLYRFPNSDEEFETMVLGRIKLHRFHGNPVIIDHFTPGSRQTPASFRLTVKGTAATGPFTVRLEYYGCEYVADPFMKGTLRRISSKN